MVVKHMLVLASAGNLGILMKDLAMVMVLVLLGVLAGVMEISMRVWGLDQVVEKVTNSEKNMFVR
jgi:predicted Kef-type K+ transport protein